jgi:6-phosphogluconolactonase (cycloisomerase 2 family)
MIDRDSAGRGGAARRRVGPVTDGEIVHIGGYTADGGGRGSGVVAALRDPQTGGLTVLGTAAVTPSPSFLARHPTLAVLYAVNEVAEGTVSAWRIEPDGALNPLGVHSTGGDSPCHLAPTPDGRYLVVANYGSGSIALHPLDSDGRPGPYRDLVVHQGHGADPERQEGPHAHMVSPDPAGTGPLLAVDLGTDSVHRYDLEPAAGRLVPRGPEIRISDGTGPRHLARHPDGRRCFLVGELAPVVIGYEITADGALHRVGQVASSGRPGPVQPSEIAVSPDGRFLHVANRGVGTLSTFALDGELPRLVAEVDTGGEWPRHFALTDAHLYVADERADLIRIFALDPVTGVPTALGEPVPVPSPSCVLL